MKAKGDKASYGAPNTISVAAGELLKQMAGLQAVQVQYKATPEAIPDLHGGQLDYLWADGTFASGQIAGKRLKGIAVTTGKRSAAFPDLPTLDEGGVKGYDLTAWWGAWFPANTPKPIVDKMNGWLTQILASQEAKDFLTKTAAATPFPGTPQSTHDYLVKETKFWGEMFALAKVEKQ
jgi:tripartite-type tricarboxylate transporter receptor subunit TctC